MDYRLTELGKGKNGSVFAYGDFVITARREGRTVGGMKIWKITVKREGRIIDERVVYLTKRRELRDAVLYAIRMAHIKLYPRLWDAGLLTF